MFLKKVKKLKDSNKTVKLKIFGADMYKKVCEAEKNKYYVLGVQVALCKKRSNSRKYKLLGIPLFKIIKKQSKKIIEIFGIKFTKKNKLSQFVFAPELHRVVVQFEKNKIYKKLAIFASFNKKGIIEDYVVYYLQGLKKVVDGIIFVTDNPILPSEIEKIKDLVIYAQCERHEEYDFGSYKRGYVWAFNKGLLKNAEELVFCNDSCYGPVYPFEQMFDEMRKRDCDFWGMTSNEDIKFPYHLQSFFLTFNQNVFRHESFGKFLLKVEKQSCVWDVICKYEIGLTRYLVKQGFVCDSYVRTPLKESIEAYSKIKNNNPTIFPLSLIKKYGAPLVKVKAINGGFRHMLQESVPDVLSFMDDVNPKLSSIINATLSARNKAKMYDYKPEKFIKEVTNFIHSKSSAKIKNVLLISHEFSYTGAPLSLLQTAKCLNEMGYEITTVSLQAGELEKEFGKYGKTYVCSDVHKIYIMGSFYDVAIINTLAAYKEYAALRDLMPTIWWIREDISFCECNEELHELFKNARNLYAMSDYSKSQFLYYNPIISVIKHGIDDYYNGKAIDYGNLTFAVIGSIEERKGQDVLVSALRHLPAELRDKAKFYIVGKKFNEEYFNRLGLNNFANVEYCPQITDHDEMMKFYESVSCIIVPSRKEPTSRVAIEAMMMGRPVIMSDHVGASYLLNGKNGFLFESENDKQLAEILENVITNAKQLKIMGEEARSAYLANNSINVYKNNLKKMFDQVEKKLLMQNACYLERVSGEPDVRDLTLSIIVPIFNALDDLKKLIASIEKAKFAQTTQVVLIDDCSTDGEVWKYLEELSCSSKYKIIKNETNMGFVKTCNMGIKASTGDIVVLLNSDTIIPYGFEAKIKHCFQSDTNIAIASPVASNSGFFNIPCDELQFYKIAKVVERIFCNKYPLFTPEGFCFCCRRQYLQNIGMLDEVYGKGYCEEDDLVMKAIIAGYKTVLINDLFVYHKRHASFTLFGKQKLFEHNRRIFEQRYENMQNAVREKMNVRQLVDGITKNILENC